MQPQRIPMRCAGIVIGGCGGPFPGLTRALPGCLTDARVKRKRLADAQQFQQVRHRPAR